MKCLLNTPCVATEKASLPKDGETVVGEIDGRVAKRTPSRVLDQIILFSGTAASPDAMHLAARSGISMAWPGCSGKLRARIEGPQSGNVILRRAASRYGRRGRGLPVARAVAAAKVTNQRTILPRHLRDCPDTPGEEKVGMAQRMMADAARQALAGLDLDVQQDHEGKAGHAGWSAFGHLIRPDDSAMKFPENNRRPPRNPVNVVLSFF